MSGGGNTTATTKTDPPAFLTPYLGAAAAQAAGVYSNGAKQFYPGQTLAPQSGATQTALSQTEQRATQGAPAVQAGQNFIEAGLSRPAMPAYTANSNLFGAATNPQLDATFNQAALRTQNQLSSEFARSGRNVGAAQGLRAQQLGDLATNIYGGAYESERNRMAAEQGQNQGINANAAENAAQRQQGLLGYGIPYANQDYADLQQLASVGGARDQYAQQGINADRERYDFTQNAPGQQIDDYIRRLTGFMGAGGTQTTTQPYNSNPIGGALGGAASGAALGSAFPVIGTGIGAIGGGLLGGIFG